MYILEFLTVNPTQNLFISDLCLSIEEEKQDCNNKILAKSSHLWDRKIGNIKRTVIKLSNGAYQQQTLWSYFNTMEDAEEFFKIRLYYNHPYRKLESDFVKNNNLLTEVNILHSDETLAKIVHSCNTDNCMKYGNCKSLNQGGCFEDVRAIGNNLPKYFHIKEISRL